MSDHEKRSSEEPLRARVHASAADAPGGDVAAEADAAAAHAARAEENLAADDGAAIDVAAGADADGVGEASEVQGDIDELVALTAQRDDYLALAQRTQADFENYKKRVARDAAQALGRGVCKLAK